MKNMRLTAISHAIRSWLAKGHNHTSAPRLPRRGPVLVMESLEPRVLLSADLSASPAAVATDKLGYAPEETAVITASNFEAGETVAVQVVRDDGTAYGGWSIGDGGANDLDGRVDGNITTHWMLPQDAPGNS